MRGVRCGGRLTSHNLSFTFQIGNCINILVGSQMMLPRVFLLRPKLSSTIYSLAENGPWCPRKIPRFHQQLITLSLVFSSYDRVPIRIEGKTTAQHRLWTGGQEHERFCRLEPKWPLFNDWKSPCFWLRTFRGWEPTEICTTINLQQKSLGRVFWQNAWDGRLLNLSKM